jgi:hypothetical protein
MEHETERAERAKRGSPYLTTVPARFLHAATW